MGILEVKRAREAARAWAEQNWPNFKEWRGPLSQGEVGREAGAGQPIISLVECGRISRVGIHTLMDIVDVYRRLESEHSRGAGLRQTSGQQDVESTRGG